MPFFLWIAVPVAEDLDVESNNVFVSVFVLVGETLLTQAVPREVRFSTHTISATARAF